MTTTTIRTAAIQYVRESDGTVWRQELCWAEGEGFTGRWNPEPVDDVPAGAARLDIESIEWTPCTAGEHAVAAWIAGIE